MTLTSYPAPQERMLKTLRYLREREHKGATWFELGQNFDWHHGQSSAVLSTLHREGRISRLKEKRGKSYVYIDNMWIGDRETGKHGRQTHEDPYSAGYSDGYTAGYQDGINEAKAMAGLILQNVNDPLTLHTGQCWRNHPSCAIKAVINQIEAQKRRRAA